MYFKQILHNEVLWKSFRFEVPKHTTYLCLCVLPSSFWKCSLHCSIYSGVGDMTENYGLNWIWNDSVLSVFFFWGAMSPQDLYFMAQDDILGDGVGHKICFQPASVCFHHCKYMALAITASKIAMESTCQASLYLYFNRCPPYKETLLAWLA